MGLALDAQQRDEGETQLSVFKFRAALQTKNGFETSTCSSHCEDFMPNPTPYSLNPKRQTLTRPKP